ncbi:hypothetical protein NRA35_14210 [Acinetobacter baumannii]|nr:hypothetical protein [Acinetobacter baumannii]
MDKPMTFNEWMGKQGNLALVHANCCRIAFEGGQQSMQAKVEELQKRVDEITNIATELAEYASYAEIVGGVTVNRSAVRSFCDKVFDFNRKVDQELEQALKGEG